MICWEDSLSLWLIHWTRLVPAGSWEPQLLSLWTPPWGCWSVLATWRGDLPRDQGEHGEICRTIRDLASKATWSRFCHILLAPRTSCDSLWGGTTQGHEYSGARITGGWLPHCPVDGLNSCSHDCASATSPLNFLGLECCGGSYQQSPQLLRTAPSWVSSRVLRTVLTISKHWPPSLS